MNDRLIARAEQRGFITRPEILDSGYQDRDIREAIHVGLLTRIGTGHALSAHYLPLTPEARSAARGRAVFHRHGGAVALTHQSAAVMHGLQLWGVSLEEVQVTRLDGGRGRHKAHVQHRVGQMDEADVLARTGFAWELYRHLAEFDGRVKFDGTYGNGGFESVFTEKRREDLARAEQWGMSRLIWDDLEDENARSTAIRVKAAPDQSRSLYGRTVIA